MWDIIINCGFRNESSTSSPCVRYGIDGCWVKNERAENELLSMIATTVDAGDRSNVLRYRNKASSETFLAQFLCGSRHEIRLSKHEKM